MDAFRLFLILLVSVCLTSVDAYAQVRLKLGHVAGESHSIGTAATRFSRALDEISSGEVQVDISPRSELGNVGDMWVQMQTGSLDMQTIDIGAITLLKEARELMAMWTPFLFRDQQHYRNYILSTEFATAMGTVQESAGIRMVRQIGERAPRIISTTNQVVASVDDMHNLKIRVPGNPMFMDVFKYWNSQPTPIKPSEVTMSLKTGLVDGQDNGIIDIGNTGSTVLKHVTPINWARSGIGLFFSEIKWGKLTNQHRNWILQAADIAATVGEQEYERLMAESWVRLAEMNILITEPDISGFLPVTDFIVEKYEGDWWQNGQVSRIREIE